MAEKAEIDLEWSVLIQKAKNLGLTKEEVRRFLYESNSKPALLKKTSSQTNESDRS